MRVEQMSTTSNMLLIVFFLQFTILCNQYFLSVANPLYGRKVKYAPFDNFPFMVSFTVKRNRLLGHFCGGSLITKRYVLTAEHCLDDFRPKEIQVLVGTNDLLEGTLHDIESWITYEDWAKKNNIDILLTSNDIAVVKLAKDVIDPEVKVIALSKLTKSNLIGKTVKTAGWGESECGYVSRYLLTINLNIITDSMCLGNIFKITGKTYKRISGNLMCSNTRPPALLEDGDSGGPVLYNNELVGINESTTPDKKGIGRYDLRLQNTHVYIDYYRTFIEDAIKE